MSVADPTNPKQTFGVLFIGFTLSMAGYGFTFFQTYVYFSGYPADHWGLKLFVSMIFALDTVTSALVSKTAHTYLVLSLPYIDGLVELQRTFNAQFLLSTLAMFGVQLFFSLRIWKLSQNIWAAGLSAIISVAVFCLSLAMVASMFNTPLFAHLASIRALIAFALAFTMLASLVEFIALVQYSKRSPERTLFDEIYLYLFPRGLVGTAIWFGCLLLFVTRSHKVYWIPMYLTAVKVSINAMLSMLNSRTSFRGKGLNEEDPSQSTPTNQNQSFNTHHRITTLSNMFNHAATESQTIHISRTVEHGQMTDDATSKRTRGYSLDEDSDPRAPFGSVGTKPGSPAKV
ncbi:hypothetical protein C8R46DRAFT_1083426 [Mycena filopes]|nr:hypothetical protein C8R46DRAFT_1083426 [Mycena filopes]